MPDTTAKKKVKIACSNCGQHLDVTGVEPFSKVACPTCQTKLLVPMVIANYQLLSPLGSGGMGTVYKAFDTTLQRFVAVKLMKRELASDRKFVEDFTREARAAAALNHANIAQILSFGELDGRYYLVMELLESGSLDHKIETQKRVSEMDVLNIGIQVASALGAAQKRGLIHRDIKPGNILFNNEGQAKVVDFGLARFAEGESEKKTEEDGIWGTPYYIAPEKLNGEPEDFRSDMYSLGGTLFHALAGRAPFEADTATEVVLKHLKAPALSLKTFAPDICDDTAQVIGTMLKKNPDERYESYEDLVVELQHAKRAAVTHAQSRAASPHGPVNVTITMPGVAPVSKKGVFGTLVILALCIAAGYGVWRWRDRIFGNGESTTLTPIATPAPAPVKSGPDWFEVWESADRKLASGQYKQALVDYQEAEAMVRGDLARRATLVCQIGLARYLMNDADAAKQSFADAAKSGAGKEIPDKFTRDNCAPVIAKIVTGALKPADVEPKLTSQLPWAWALAQLYLGAQALAENRYADAAKWWNGYVKAPRDQDALWVTQFQAHLRPVAGELSAIPATVDEATQLQADGRADEANQRLAALAASIKSPLLKDRVKQLQDNIKKTLASHAREEEAKFQQEFARVSKLREQFETDAKALAQAEPAVPAAVAECKFDAAAQAFTSAAGKMTTPELKQIAEARGAIYQQLATMKQQAIQLMPKTPYARGDLTNRRGGRLLGSAAKADGDSITFVQEHGEVAAKWQDLSPITMLTLLANYGNLAAKNQPPAMASNFVALAWLSRDYHLDKYVSAYAEYAAKLSPEAKTEWDRVSGPMPKPPELPVRGGKQAAPAAPAGIDTDVEVKKKKPSTQ